MNGHETLKEVERYTKAAKRARLATSAIAALANRTTGGFGTGEAGARIG
jgi:hypothetical protein